jgi:hypothetical protein
MSAVLTPVPPSPQQPEDEGSTVLLIGGPGSGKSYSLPTIIEAGLDLFVLGTEPRFRESIEQSISDRKLDWNKYHYCHVYPATSGWAQLIDSATTVGNLNYEALTKLKSGIGKDKYKQFVDLLNALANYRDERNGKSYGAVDKFDPSTCAFALDSITGAAMMSMDLMVGSKPVAHEGEWGVAMNQLERWGNMCTASIKCFLVMTGHIEKETNPDTGGSQLYVSTLGRKLSPKWGRFYSEIVHAYREGTEYYWSTVTPMFDLKRRFLPLQDKMKPSFVPIIDAWQKRRKLSQAPKEIA